MLFFVEESRAAEELKSLGKIGPLNVVVKPSEPPRVSRSSRGASKGASGRGAPGGGQQQPRFSRRSDDDDILMGEEPKQVLTVSLYHLC